MTTFGTRGHIELDRAIDSIIVGHRQRRDLGDLTTLIDSIRRLGMLQPVTISPEGILICGARRLEAAKQLGMRQINVWVRSGLSSQLQLVLAEQHENTIAKPLTPIEAASLYRELKALLAEEAARRQQAAWFGAEQAENAGGANLAPPGAGKARSQAARLVTGRNSYTTLERVNELEDLAAALDTPEPIRQLAQDALDNIAAEGKVAGHYYRVKQAHAAGSDHLDGGPSPVADTGDSARAPSPTTSKPEESDQVRRRERLYGMRSFLLTWNDLADWTLRFDPAEIGPGLTDEQWDTFEETVASTVTFLEAARDARSAFLH